MNVLHIFRSKPDENVAELKKPFAQHDEKERALYAKDTDWDGVVDDIFASDKVICWW